MCISFVAFAALLLYFHISTTNNSSKGTITIEPKLPRGNSSYQQNDDAYCGSLSSTARNYTTTGTAPYSNSINSNSYSSKNEGSNS